MWSDRLESAAPDGFGYVVRDKVNDVGYAAITVPGMLAGLGEIHRRYGSLRWKDLVLRAVRCAEEGFVVPAELAEFWIRPGLYGRVSTRDRLTFTETGRRICLKEDGSTYKGGEIFRQPLLADTYRRLADEGPDSFYRGPMAREIADDWQRHGALVTGQDLGAYRPQVHGPLRASYRGHEIRTTPLPGGGVALLQALRLLERVDVAALDHNSPSYLDTLGSVLRVVWANRLAHHGDPAFGGSSEDDLLSERYLDELSNRAKGLGGGRLQAGADSESTTQLTIVDFEDTCVSFSHSLGYASGVFVPGLGFMYNNCMSAFDPRPGRRNSIEPGKARSTAVAETIVFRDDQPWLVLGSPGAARITAALVQVIVNAVDFGMSAAEAVVCPRFDAYGDEERRLIVDSRFPRPVMEGCRGLRWEVTQSPKAYGVVGRVYAVEIDSQRARRLVAGVDPGEPGSAAWS